MPATAQWDCASRWGWEEGEGRLPGIPEPRPASQSGISLPEQTLGDLERVPGLPGSFSGQSAFGKKNAGFCWGLGGVLLLSGLQIRIKDPQTLMGDQGPRGCSSVSPVL